jgi:hypothetical protein
MDTDKHLYKLFTAAPEQLYFLLGLAAPKEVRARAESFKEIQTESDLVAEPVEEIEPARMIEFHGYRDPRFVPKVMLRCALYRIRHPARSIRCHIVYLDREFRIGARGRRRIVPADHPLLAGTRSTAHNTLSGFAVAECSAAVGGGERPSPDRHGSG